MSTYNGQHEERIGIGMEGTYGIIGTHAMYVPCKFVADYKRDTFSRSAVNSGRYDVSTYKREGMVQPKMDGDIEPDTFGFVLYSFFGTKTTTNDGTNWYKHTFTPAGTIKDALPSLSVKQDYGQGVVLDYTGLRCDNLKIDCKSKSNVTFSASFYGKNEVTGTTNANLVYGTYNPFRFIDITLTVGTYTYNPYDVSMELKQDYSDGYRVGTDYNTTKPLPKGKMTGNIKFTLDYSEAAQRNFYLGGSSQLIDVYMSGAPLYGTGTTSLKIRLPKTALTAAPYGRADGVLSLAVESIILEGTNAEGTGAIQAELMNYTSNY